MRNTITSLLLGAGLCVTSTLAVTSSAFAQGVPTIDTQSITQQITQIKRMLEDFGIQSDMLDQLVDQLVELQRQTTELEGIYAALTGKADIQGLSMGGGLDTVLDPRVRTH
jgi:type IV secretion system protein VirB5